MGYAPEAWRDFAVTTGGLAGALTGLLFVAVSLHGGALAKSLALRSRAAQTLVLFMTPAISALVLVAPQPGTVLGAELLAVATASGAALYVLDRRAGRDPGARMGVARYVERVSPNTVTAVLFGIAGLTFLIKAGGGLYWLIPAVLAGLIGGVINAWLFLVSLHD